jgi:hypothetical protein
VRGISDETGNDGSRYHPGGLSAAPKPAGHSDPATNARHDRHGERAMCEAPSHLYAPHFGE